MRIAPGALLALLLLPATGAGAPYASRLDALAAAVEDAVDALPPSMGPLPREERDLLRVRDALQVARATLLYDLRQACTTTRLLDRSWSGEFEPVLGDAVDALEADVLFERDALSGWTGWAGNAADEARLRAGLRTVERWLARAEAREGRAGKVRALMRACAAAFRTREVLDFQAPEAAPPPFAGAAPAFTLPDANPLSATYGQDVAPADHAGRVTAWYYTRLT